MENLAKVFGKRPAEPFMEWFVRGRGDMTERRVGPPREKLASDIGSKPDGVMFVGDSFRLVVRPPFSGHIQFWNLGTSGKSRLIGNMRINAECAPFAGQVDTNSPTTAETGRNDILIGIVTRIPVVIEPEAMGAARQTVSTRGSFASVEEVRTVSLSELPESDWAWSILETEVRK